MGRCKVLAAPTTYPSMKSEAHVVCAWMRLLAVSQCITDRLRIVILVVLAVGGIFQCERAYAETVSAASENQHKSVCANSDIRISLPDGLYLFRSVFQAPLSPPYFMYDEPYVSPAFAVRNGRLKNPYLNENVKSTAALAQIRRAIHDALLAQKYLTVSAGATTTAFDLKTVAVSDHKLGFTLRDRKLRVSPNVIVVGKQALPMPASKIFQMDERETLDVRGGVLVAPKEYFNGEGFKAIPVRQEDVLFMERSLSGENLRRYFQMSGRWLESTSPEFEDIAERLLETDLHITEAMKIQMADQKEYLFGIASVRTPLIGVPTRDSSHGVYAAFSYHDGRFSLIALSLKPLLLATSIHVDQVAPPALILSTRSFDLSYQEDDLVEAWGYTQAFLFQWGKSEWQCSYTTGPFRSHTNNIR